LLERIANQRHTLALQIRPVTRSLHVGDQVRSWLDQGKLFALRYPLTLAAVVAVVVVLRPAVVLRWTRRGFFAWRTFTAVRSALPSFLSRLF